MAHAVKDIADEQAMHKRLWEWLPRLVTEQEAEGVAVHFGDLYGAAAHLRALVEQLVSLDPGDRDAVLKTLLAIRIELYDHTAVHMAQLHGPLQDLLDGLCEEEPE